MNKLIRNAIKCKHCGDIIESKYRHDFVTCSCGKVSIDGGLDYCRVTFTSKNPEDDFIDLCEYEEVNTASSLFIRENYMLYNEQKRKTCS